METRLKIIGSSHISKESVNEVRNEVDNFSPDIIAIELDKKRLSSLFKRKEKQSFSDAKKMLGIKGAAIISFLSYVQKKLGKIVNTEPGSEMKEAVIIAKNKKLKLELIDQDIEITLINLSNAITFRVIMRIMKDIITAPFQKRKKISIDLNSVPDEETINMMLSEVKEHYPEIHKALIDDRNKIMAKRLYTLTREYPEKKILAVVGAGHKSEMLDLIRKYEKEN